MGNYSRKTRGGVRLNFTQRLKKAQEEAANVSVSDIKRAKTEKVGVIPIVNGESVHSIPVATPIEEHSVIGVPLEEAIIVPPPVAISHDLGDTVNRYIPLPEPPSRVVPSRVVPSNVVPSRVVPSNAANKSPEEDYDKMVNPRRKMKMHKSSAILPNQINNKETQELQEKLAKLGIVLPQNPPPPPPPPSKKPATPKDVVTPLTFVDVIKAILEDNIKIKKKGKKPMTLSREVDSTMIEQFYMERVTMSEETSPNLQVQMMGLRNDTPSLVDMIIPWTLLNECTPILIAAKFGLVRPCKQIME
jgi:hypothetical protein